MARKKLVGRSAPAKTTRKKKAAKKKSSKKTTKKRATKKRAASPSPVDRIDANLVRSALAKQAKGESLTARQAEALRSYHKKKSEESRESAYSAMPKGDYVKLSGRSHKVLNEQADRYGLALKGSKIDLGKVLRAFHDLLARNKNRIAVDDEDESLQGSPDVLDKKRLVEIQILDVKLREMRDQLIDIGSMRVGLVSAFENIRKATDLIQREFGTVAAGILNDAVEAAVTQIAESIGQDQDGSDEATKS